MKDRIGTHRWENRAMKNPPAHSRFLRTRTSPNGEIHTKFSDAAKDFRLAMRVKKTLYEKYFGDL